MSMAQMAQVRDENEQNNSENTLASISKFPKLHFIIEVHYLNTRQRAHNFSSCQGSIKPFQKKIRKITPKLTQHFKDKFHSK